MSIIQKAVGYIRVSTQMQVDEGYSLENQSVVIKKECAHKGWELTEIFSDEGISGATVKDRKGIQNLMQYVKENDIQFVLVFKISRLSRSIVEALNIVEFLQSNNCNLIAIADNVDTSSPLGKYFLAMGAIFAEMERENIKKQVRAGMEQKARNGGWSAGKPPLGYDLIDKKLVINEDESEIVQTIYREYLGGKGYKAIAEGLNSEEKQTKLKKPFNGNGIKFILQNPMYYGLIRWGLSKNSKVSSEVKEDPVIVENDKLAIISKEIYNQVQEKIKTNPRSHVKRFNGNHLLSGLLRCPHCGEYGMSIQISKDKKSNKVYEYYICNQYQTYKTCVANGLKKDKIEEEFLSLFEEKVSNSKKISEMLNGLNNLDNQLVDLEKLIRHKQVNINKINKEIDNLINVLTEDNTPKNVVDRIKENIDVKSKEVENEKLLILEAERKKFTLSKSEFNVEEIKQVLNNIGKIIKHIDKEKQQALIRKVVDKITVKDGRIERIYFKFEQGITIEGEGEGDSDESPLKENNFRIERDTVNRIINRGKKSCK